MSESHSVADKNAFAINFDYFTYIVIALGCDLLSQISPLRFLIWI